MNSDVPSATNLYRLSAYFVSTLDTIAWFSPAPFVPLMLMEVAGVLLVLTPLIHISSIVTAILVLSLVRKRTALTVRKLRQIWASTWMFIPTLCGTPVR